MRTGVCAAAGALVLLVAMSLSAASAAAFSAHGSAEQVYATGLGAHQRMTLVNGAGRTVQTGRSTSLTPR